MSRHQLEQLVSDASLQVPFGIVELQPVPGQIAELNLSRKSISPDLPIEIRDLVDRSVCTMLPNEWAGLVFFYVSLIPYQLPENKDLFSTPESWQETLEHARAASPTRPIANVMFFDGLPATPDCYPRIISLAAFNAIQRVMAINDLELRVWPYERFNGHQSPTTQQTAATQEPEKVKLLVVISPYPEQAWDQIQKIKTQLSVVPEFFEQFRPSNQEMVPGITYLQVDNTGGDPVCQARSLSPDQGQIISETIAHIQTSKPWSAMVYGDNLASAILDAYDLSVSLPPPGNGRKWPADCPEHPCNWLTRRLDEPMPPYPGEPDSSIATYPKAVDKLELDRWLFWSWQCGRWSWPKIYEASSAFGQLARPKDRISEEPDKSRTARTRAANYAEWMGYKLRPGRSGSGRKKRSV